MTTSLITAAQYAQLIANGALGQADASFDPLPIVKLFTPDAQAVWLITEAGTEDPDILFGLCDLGVGSPELGTVSYRDLQRLRGPMGLRVERDRHFRPTQRLSVYARLAREAGRIVMI